MRILVVGRAGQVAQELARIALPPDTEIACLGREEGLDLRNAESIEAAVAARGPDAVINAAAWTAVDDAEAHEAEAFALNAVGPAALARACAAHRVPLVHVSTDYVFDGTVNRPRREDDPVCPASAYGRSKLAGEWAVRAEQPHGAVLRVAWVFSAHGGNFVKTMLRLGAERDRLRVVDDQVGDPTAASEVARAGFALARRLAEDGPGSPASGVFHFSSGAAITWADFARRIFELAGDRLPRIPVVEGIATSEYPTPARRPSDSRLDGGRLADRVGLRARPFDESLAEVLDALLSTPTESGS